MVGTTSVLHAQVTNINIDKAVLLTLPAATEEQIAVGSDSPTGSVWTPWPEPIFKRHGELCMMVPTTESQQFFQTVPGRQLADGFDDTWGPFTNRNPWMTRWYDPPFEQWVVTNGVLRLSAVQSPDYGFLLMPLGTNAAATVRDFYTSIDILDWATSTTNWTYLSLAARGVFYSPTWGNGYIGILMKNPDGSAGTATLFIWDGDNMVEGPSFDCVANPPPYRLEFSGVGNPFCELRLRVLNRTTKELIAEQPPLVRAKFTQGWAGIWMNTRNGPGDTFTITADNYFVTGTKP